MRCASTLVISALQHAGLRDSFKFSTVGAFRCAFWNRIASVSRPRSEVPIDVAEALRPRLDGPADTGDAGDMAHERVAAVDGEVVESDDEGEVHVNAAIAEPEHPEEMMPAMHVCADELASGDLDELQAIRKVRVELEQLQEAIRQDELAPISAVVPKKRIHALQRATQAMIVRSVAQKVQAAARSVEEVEKGSVVKNVSEFIEAYAQGTGSKPLSMYGPEMWAMCFPHRVGPAGVPKGPEQMKVIGWEVRTDFQ